MSFEFDFTKEHLQEIISADADDWYDALCELLPKYGITTERRVAHFLSQCAHESAGLRYPIEIHDGSNYEFRRDIGNIYPGDGVKFAGTGWILYGTDGAKSIDEPKRRYFAYGNNWVGFCVRRTCSSSMGSGSKKIRFRHRRFPSAMDCR